MKKCFQFVFFTLFLFYSSLNAFSASLKIAIPQLYSNGNTHKSILFSDDFYRKYFADIARKTGWSLRFYPMTFEESLASIKDGSIDIAASIEEDTAKLNNVLITNTACASEYFFITSKRDNQRFHSFDFDEDHHIYIGIKSNQDRMEEALDKLISDLDLHVTKIFYYDEISLDNDFDSGFIDLKISSLIPDLLSEKVIYKFHALPLYFMVNAAKPELKQQLDSTLEEYSKTDPYYFFEYLSTEFKDLSFAAISNLTKEERDFIKENPKIDVVMRYNNNEQELRDFERSFWHELSLITGIEFNMTDRDFNYLSNSILLSSGYPNQIDNSSFRNGQYTNPYRENTISMIYAPSKNIYNFKTRFVPKEPLQIAITPDINIVLNYFRQQFVPFKAVIYENGQKALEAVEKGICDAALIRRFNLLTIYNIRDYPTLNIEDIKKPFYVPVSIAIAGEPTGKLLSILNKSFHQIPVDFHDNGITNAMIGTDYVARDKLDLSRVFETHIIPLNVVIRIILSLIITALIAMVIYTIRTSLYYKKKSETDYLTGRLTFTAFSKKAKKYIFSNKEKNYVLACIGIRNFSYVNRNFGISQGDEVLKFVADLIKKIVKPTSFNLVSRGLGDNFYFLATIDPNTIHQRIEYISKDINSGIKFSDEISFFVKVGVILFGQDIAPIESFNELLAKATYARREITPSLVNFVNLYTLKMEETRRNTSLVEDRVVQALQNNEFYVKYQPKVDLKTGKVIGAEALVRWETHFEANQELTYPGFFMPILERNGLSASVDFFVYKTVFDFLTKQINENKKIVPISINMSRTHTNPEKFVKDFTDLFKQYNIPTRYIEIEIVERAGDTDQLLSTLTNLLHKEGFLVDMDDFGTGESSLNMLNEIPVDVIKIDQRFLEKAEVNNQSRIILENVIKMMNSLNKITICEGVETEAQKEFLLKAGCNFAQGYLFSKPLYENEFIRFIETNN